MNDNSLLKKDPLKAAIDNNGCGTCRVNLLPPPCPGHLLADGCGDDTDEDYYLAEDNVLTEELPEKPLTSASKDNRSDEKQPTVANEWRFLLDSNPGTIQYDPGLVFILCNRVLGQLIFRPKPPLSREELELLKKYLDIIQLEFNEFKLKLAEEGISSRSFIAVIKEHELTVTIPNPRFFTEFMMVLAKKNLLPLPGAAEKKKQQKLALQNDAPELETVQEERKSYPTPFDDLRRGPRPKGDRKNLDVI